MIGFARRRNAPAVDQRSSSLEMGKAGTTKNYIGSGRKIQVRLIPRYCASISLSRRLADGVEKEDSSEPTGERDDQKRFHEADARGGFSHKMMEQFESLRKQGYTVLLGDPDSNETKSQPPLTTNSSGPIDYSKFDNVEDSSDDEIEEDHNGHDDAYSKIKSLGGCFLLFSTTSRLILS